MVIFGYGLLVFLRVQAVHKSYGSYNGCLDCLDLAVVASDLRPLAAVLVLIAGAWIISIKFIRISLAFLAVAIVFAYAVDLGIFLLLGHRLRVLDFFRYAGETHAAWTVAAPLLKSPQGIALLVGFIISSCSLIFIILSARRSWRVALMTLLLAIIFASAIKLIPDPGYVIAIAYQDVLTNNKPRGVNVTYSEKTLSNLNNQSPHTQQCISGATKNKSVILIVVESLSLYHSKLQSGIMDATPGLDALAQENSYLSEFHANGFTTDGGLISLLTGHVPLPSVGRYESMQAYTGFEKPQHEAFQRLEKRGYGTQFFTTGNLGFLGKGKWLSGLGFSHVEGSENPFYAKLPRGGFDEAGDHALYKRYLQWYDSERKTEENFSALLTVTTHPPFLIPGTDKMDELSAFRYADQEVSDFVRELKKRNYFEDGIVIIMGDHRSMTPRRKGEWELLNEGAVSRVPAIVIGSSGLPHGPTPGRWQQTDFLPSLLYMAGLNSCTNNFQGRFLGDTRTPAQFVLHAQGAQPDRVTVWEKYRKTAGQIELNGDNTRWIEGGPSDETEKITINFINSERATRAALPADFLPLLMRGKK